MADEGSGRRGTPKVVDLSSWARRVLVVAGVLLLFGLVVGMRFQVRLLVTLCSGVLAVTVSLYAFVRLWPASKSAEQTARQVEDAKAYAAQVQAETKPGPLRFRRGQVKLSQRATKALAMTIKGIIGQGRYRKQGD